MKTLIIRTLSVAGLAGLLWTAVAQQLPPPRIEPPPVMLITTNPPPEMIMMAATNPPAATETAPATNAPVVAPATPLPPPEPPLVVLGENEMRLNFRNAPLDVVLSHLSEACGFIIELQTPMRGTVDVFSAKPVTKDEAIDLLNSMLNKNGYAAIRNGRKLTIVSKTEAVRRDIPVKTGGDPEAIPRNDEIVTQIIPIRFVEAAQLAKDLAPMISPQALIVANEAGNSIAVTDTQANIRHLVEIIKAIDSSAEDETQVRVFALKHADPIEMATLLTDLFPDQSSAQAPMRSSSRSGSPFGSSSGGPLGFISSIMSGRPPGPPPGTGPSGQQQRVRKRAQVVAVPDARTSSVVVTASKDLMEQIAEVVQQLDFQSPKETKVQVFRLENADPREVLPVLQDMFQSTTSSRGSRSSSQNSPLMNRIQQNQTQSGTGTSSSRSSSGGLSNRRGVSGSSF
jgi:type II secretory pathway component GspD/PulD (secretin)